MRGEGAIPSASLSLPNPTSLGFLNFKAYSDAGILTSLFTCGSAGVEYGPLVTLIFVGILRCLNFALTIPFAGRLVGLMPLVLETLREKVGRLIGVDIFNLYYVSLGAFFGISTFVDTSHYKVARFAKLVLQPKGVRKHLGTATRVLIRSRETGKALFWFVNIHYIHFTNDEGKRMRVEECKRVLKWMQGCTGETDRCIIAGDHNTLMKNEGIFKLMKANGYESAHKRIHGKEPESTWPTGLKSIYMDTDGFDLPAVKNGGGICLDFIFFRGKGLTVKDAGVVGNKPSPEDKTLYPSDHAAIWADILVE